MRQPLKLQPVKREAGYLAAIIAGLAAGLIVVPLDAAPEVQRPVPLPPPRPVTPGDQSSSSPPAKNHDLKQPGQTDEATHDGEACLARLRAGDISFDVPAMPTASKASCVIQVPVRLKSIKTRGPRTVTEVHLPEQPVISCQFAERLTAWLGNLVAPLIAGRMSTDLRAVRTGPGYECRNRNGAATGKLSAHAVGNAIDITTFELSSGKSIPIKPDGDETARNVVDTVRTAACGWFTTVLGPGADAAHTDHLHVDTALHGTSDRYRICQ